MTEKPSCYSEMSQAERFRETACQLERDKDEARFKEKLGKIAKAKPSAPATGKPE